MSAGLTSATHYDEAKRIAAGGGAAARCRLARTPGVPPEILYYLAEDEDATVRRAAAGNPDTPVHAGPMLARDADPEVRCALAEKFGRLAPGLGADARDRLSLITVEVLALLARDQLPRVRRLVADTVKDVAAAPPALVEDVIRQVARDDLIDVARPVLSRSPLLTDDDLLAIVAAARDPDVLSAIAGRDGVAAPVADAVVGRTLSDAGSVVGNPATITALLANPSAQIREETLDRILDAAPGHEPWHAPLVARPSLPAGAVRRIAGFVAETLLERLRVRDDLGPEAAAAVAEAVRKRVAATGPDAQEKKPAKPSAEDEARRLFDAGGLDADVVADALVAGRRAFAMAGLALLSGLPGGTVDRIVESRSARAAVALAWKAGLDMTSAMQVQTRLAGISPTEALKPRGGTFPMTEADMQWQIEFFGG